MNNIQVQNDKIIVNNPSLKAKGKLYQQKTAKRRSWIQQIESWLVRKKHREELLRLPDYLLKDIGLTREQVLQESRKSFWQSGIF